MLGLYVKYRKAIDDAHETCAIELHTARGTTDRCGAACILTEIINLLLLFMPTVTSRHVFYVRMFLALAKDSSCDYQHRRTVVITY